MQTEKVQRQKDARGAICRDCGIVFNISTCPYWHWSKSMNMHADGTGHKLDLYRIVPGPRWLNRQAKELTGALI